MAQAESQLAFGRGCYYCFGFAAGEVTWAIECPVKKSWALGKHRICSTVACLKLNKRKHLYHKSTNILTLC